MFLCSSYCTRHLKSCSRHFTFNFRWSFSLSWYILPFFLTPITPFPQNLLMYSKRREETSLSWQHEEIGALQLWEGNCAQHFLLKCLLYKSSRCPCFCVCTADSTLGSLHEILSLILSFSCAWPTWLHINQGLSVRCPVLYVVLASKRNKVWSL